MSRENVELMQRAFDAFNRRDLEAYLALMDDEVESGSRLVAIEGDYRGHDGVRRWWESLKETLPNDTVEVAEVRDHGNLTVAALTNSAVGSHSETPVVQRLWTVAEWREEKVVWWSNYRTEAEALEAVGLRE